MSHCVLHDEYDYYCFLVRIENTQCSIHLKLFIYTIILYLDTYPHLLIMMFSLVQLISYKIYLMHLFPKIDNNILFVQASSPTDSDSNPKLIHHFVEMGFSKKMVVKAIKENGKSLISYYVNILHCTPY
jgi:hypothetical protein